MPNELVSMRPSKKTKRLGRISVACDHSEGDGWCVNVSAVYVVQMKSGVIYARLCAQHAKECDAKPVNVAASTVWEYL